MSMSMVTGRTERKNEKRIGRTKREKYEGENEEDNRDDYEKFGREENKNN